ncbi:MAG: lipid-A-disaccharide synthase [Desulfovibrionaceae bacterium]
MNDTIWISTGEPSGDMHGALLARALFAAAPGARLAGMAGPDMRAVGVDGVFDIAELSVMGFTEVLGKLPSILRLLGRIKNTLRRMRPRAVVCVDAPSFNFRVARAAHELGIPVYYYISPKIWAWNTRRVHFIKKYVRRMICIFPFEVDFYRRYGVEVDFVGNPLLDVLDLPRLDAIAPQPGLVGFLPGSRRKEVTSLLPEMGRAARILRDRLPGLRYEIIRAPGTPEARLRELWPQDVPVAIAGPDDRYARMRTWQACVAASGTVTLETALIGLPTVVTYRMSGLTAALARRVIKVRWVSLPNLVMRREVFPELLQERATASELAAAAGAWLADPAALAAMRADLAVLRTRLGEPGAAGRAARVILDDPALA